MVEQKGKQAAGEKQQGRKPWTLREVGGKTLWDWLQLLIVPVMLSLITVAFAWQQDIRQDRIENQRAEAERELANQRAQDAALQAYLNQMSGLMLDRGLRTSEEGNGVRLLARARTITILRRLDSERNSDILQFLHEAQLISGTDPDVRLDRSNLSGANLSRVDLNGVNLSDADLTKADLRVSDRSKADLRGDSYLDKADLRVSDLSKADLKGALLNRADLSEANLFGANLVYADLTKANLMYDNLFDADLTKAELIDADLSGAYLSGADLSGAYLSGADLTNARGVTEEQLEEQTKKLKGATMPDGSKHP
jgi:uncharacterized protein YjbI with pentapeptide repeats